MPDEERLGPEWGALEGYTKDEALKVMTAYANDLERRTSRREERGGVGSDEPDTDDSPGEGEEGDDILNKVRQMNQASKEPLTAEFVSKRENARETARKYVEDNGYDWSPYVSNINQMMSNAAPEQQTDPRVWFEAWRYAAGVALLNEQAQGEEGEDEADDADTPPRNEPSETEDVRLGRMSSPKTKKRGRDREKKFEIPPEERQTKTKFERVLGTRISDEEWYRLQNEEIDTLEDYERLQEELNR